MPDIYSKITDKIISLLERGVCPWKQPWTGNEPTNLSSMKLYSGVNYLLLNSLGFESNFWCTFRQAQKLGGGIKAGEKSPAFVVFSDTWPVAVKRPDGTEKTEERWFLKYTPVFNYTQTKGIEAPEGVDADGRELKPIEACERFMECIRERPQILIGEAAAYLPTVDMITIPSMNRFRDAESYHAVVFHELTHWTGAPSRLNRPLLAHSMDRGSYGREELVAEMGAAFLCARCGIDAVVIDDSASYISGWLKALRNDRRMVVEASRSARVAVEWMAGV